jgi:hypothetical protein
MDGLNRNTAGRFYGEFRRRMAQLAAEASPFSGEIEIDESCFGSRRVRGKRGRGTGGKTVVFGLLKRGDCVCTQIVPGCKNRDIASDYSRLCRYRERDSQRNRVSIQSSAR